MVRPLLSSFFSNYLLQSAPFLRNRTTFYISKVMLKDVIADSIFRNIGRDDRRVGLADPFHNFPPVSINLKLNFDTLPTQFPTRSKMMGFPPFFTTKPAKASIIYHIFPPIPGCLSEKYHLQAPLLSSLTVFSTTK
jgi:hypothetical protein